MIDEVIQNIREQFIDEGHDDVFLQELKHVIQHQHPFLSLKNYKKTSFFKSYGNPNLTHQEP